ANAGGPQLMSVQIEAEHARLAERDIQPLAVGCGRVAGVALIRSFAFVFVLGKLRLELFVPTDLARPAVEAEEVPPQVLLVPFVRLEAIARITGNEQSVSQRDGTGSAGPGQLDLPKDVLIRRPFLGQVSFVADSHSARPTKAGPITGVG